MKAKEIKRFERELRGCVRGSKIPAMKLKEIIVEPYDEGKDEKKAERLLKKYAGA